VERTDGHSPVRDRGDSPVRDQCDVCGHDVPADDLVKTELTVAGAMCPTAMTFHTACYEKASAMWQPDPESYCTVDPLFPETGQWVLPDEGRPAGWAPSEIPG
jgi:hypothetical protein